MLNHQDLTPCKCGCHPTMTVHDNHYWVSCDSYAHGYDTPEVGGFEGFETQHEAVKAWNEFASKM